MSVFPYLWQDANSCNEEWLINQQLEAKSVTNEVEQSKIENQRIMVDVKGAVINPGVYSVTKGKRVIDVIELAGGLQENANEKSINLAQVIFDEMVLYIPKIGEEIKEELINMQNNKININNATAEQLMELKGIGEAKAQAIISYRENNGEFETIDDLLNIRGIGEKTLESFRDNIVAY
jgi:competence protein ComEA